MSRTARLYAHLLPTESLGAGDLSSNYHAMLRVAVGGEPLHQVAEDPGPAQARRAALRAPRPVYSVPELAELVGITRFAMARLLQSAQVPLWRSGRKHLVFLAELKRAFPVLWEIVLLSGQAGE